MNINEFTALIKALFRNEKGKPYPIDSHMITEIFNIFNKSGVRIYPISILRNNNSKKFFFGKDGSIDKAEFAYCWNNWIKKVTLKNQF